MSTVRALNELGSGESGYDGMVSGEMGSSSATSSISLSRTPPTRDELSDMLRNIHFTPTPRSSWTNSESGRSSGSQARAKQEWVVKAIKHETDKGVNNIMNHVRYLSSPLRLYLKVRLLLTQDVEERSRLLVGMRFSDRIKTDLVGEWNAKDTFGLKMLMKMKRIFDQVLPLLNGAKDPHDEFMNYFKPFHAKEHPNAAFYKYTAFYLFHEVMNPKAAQHPNGMVPLEHEMHAWVDGFLHDLQGDMAEVGFDIATFKEELAMRLAFELNSYASTVFKKTLVFRFDKEKHNLSPEQLTVDMYNMLQAQAATQVLSGQMVMWSTTDEDMSASTRVMGGARAKRSKRRT